MFANIGRCSALGATFRQRSGIFSGNVFAQLRSSLGSLGRVYLSGTVGGRHDRRHRGCGGRVADVARACGVLRRAGLGRAIFFRRGRTGRAVERRPLVSRKAASRSACRPQVGGRACGAGVTREPTGSACGIGPHAMRNDWGGTEPIRHLGFGTGCKRPASIDMSHEFRLFGRGIHQRPKRDACPWKGEPVVVSATPNLHQRHVY